MIKFKATKGMNTEEDQCFCFCKRIFPWPHYGIKGKERMRNALLKRIGLCIHLGEVAKTRNSGVVMARK